MLLASHDGCCPLNLVEHQNLDLHLKSILATYVLISSLITLSPVSKKHTPFGVEVNDVSK
ncbi:hypothetical protein CYCME_1276 [Cycloclasticus zancles 78-ME]|uniref:Uncharacterized protein n=1 Tax=Cycloclasticus zancles 78-ME TaxID=1198232 RepID=S5TWR0_9GAMM|nr:hypothetical protein CYCME_1276 [Cycloclasticus zancles 78-ME]